MLFNIKARLAVLGKKQVSLLPELEKRGINTNPSQLSNSLNGFYKGGKYSDIVSACNEIVSAWEQQSKEVV